MQHRKTPDLERFLSSAQRRKLKIYTKELVYFNKSTALYSRKKTENLPQDLIWDSLMAGRILLKDCSHRLISDIGSGAGFPGILLALLDPLREIWLFEPHKKKAGFLEYVRRQMKLENVRVKNIPVQEEKSSLSCAVSKAFLPLDQRLALVQGRFKKGALYYHLQSPAWERKWRSAPLDVWRSWRVKALKKYGPPLLPERCLLKAVKS